MTNLADPGAECKVENILVCLTSCYKYPNLTRELRQSCSPSSVMFTAVQPVVLSIGRAEPVALSGWGDKWVDLPGSDTRKPNQP